MNSRERFLAVVLVVAMVGVAGAVGGYQLVLKPLTASDTAIAKLQTEVEELETKKRDMEIEQFFFETRTKKKSLPQDVPFSQREYERLIYRMLQHAKFEAPVITPKAADNKSNVPLLAGKKPAYTKLDFDLQIKGELLQLVDFLYEFYRQPLLQQVRKIEILKPLRSRTEAGPESRELDIKL